MQVSQKVRHFIDAEIAEVIKSTRDKYVGCMENMVWKKVFNMWFIEFSICLSSGYGRDLGERVKMNQEVNGKKSWAIINDGLGVETTEDMKALAKQGAELQVLLKAVGILKECNSLFLRLIITSEGIFSFWIE